MKSTLRRKWALYIIKKQKKKSNIWPYIWFICAIIFSLLYSIHKTEPVLVGIVLSLIAGLLWIERKGFCEIIEEQETTINKLNEKKQ